MYTCVICWFFLLLRHFKTFDGQETLLVTDFSPLFFVTYCHVVISRQFHGEFCRDFVFEIFYRSCNTRNRVGNTANR